MVAEIQIPLPKPLHDLVLVRMDPEKKVSDGGLLLVRGKPVRTGIVMDVGPGAVSDAIPAPYRMPMSVKVGQHVHCADDRYGCVIEQDDVLYVLIPEKLILGVLP